MAKKRNIYPQLIKNIEDWPIFKLHANRKQLIEELVEATSHRIIQKHAGDLSEVIAKTIYLERIRLKEEPWKVDPPNERQFWRKIRDKLVKESLDIPLEEAKKNNEELLLQIIHRYAEEIVGTFRKKTFLFARWFLTLFFTRLLNTAASKYRLWGNRYHLSDRFEVKGNIEHVRSLMEKGTLVIVPTHFSNLDSILIAYALDAFAGLPSFTYGAGLNLYNTGYTAYFMNRLGTYRVDRRKKNPIYLDTLKMMSNLLIQKGTNNLFFPGGTRSRSGKLESRVKLGLLSTVLEAQRSLCQTGENKKIFVVPLVLSYHFVLEAPFLVEQHLRRMGKERYLRTKDDFKSLRKILKFAWRLFSEGNDIVLSIGQPIDVLGNPVNKNGESFDAYGNPIRIEDYFTSSGAILADHQRESEYTRILGNKIVERFLKDNIVLSSHLVAFSAFQVLKYQNKNLDLYGVLRLPPEDFVFPKELLLLVIAQLQDILIDLEKQDGVKLSDQIRLSSDELLKNGLKHLGTFHPTKPLRYSKKKEIVSDNFKLLYYYHNRLDDYGLDTQINWSTAKQEAMVYPK